MPAYEISLDSPHRNISSAPDIILKETDKTPEWYYQNLNWIIGFYNQPVGQALLQITSPDVTDYQNIYSSSKNPVGFMFKMMMYYLGKQPNLTFNHLTPNVVTQNIQAQWIKGQDVSEFVNHFKGLIIEKLSFAEFNAKPISKNAISKREDKINSLMFQYELAPYIKKIAEKGVEFNPPGTEQRFQTPEEIEKWIDTNAREYSSIVYTDLANGIWFSNDWFHKLIQSFVYNIITGTCGIEHYISNGKQHTKIIMPYNLISDNRIDDDYGRYDQFIGKIEPMTIEQILSDSRFSELSNEQKLEIQTMSKNGDLNKLYNTTPNILWWGNNTSSNSNMLNVATVYFRGIKDTGKRKAKNKYGNPKIEEVTYGNKENYTLSDIYKATLIGNKYLVNYGPLDNLVESEIDRTLPCFPILRYRPNTFLGESISEVARIHKIQDELDMLDFKVREMVGRAKGKVYVFLDKLANSLPKELIEDFATCGVHVATSSGEIGESSDRSRSVEMIDWTLDPNITQLVALYKERKERMGKILSISELSRGQQSKYIGLGVLRGSVAQNVIGVSHIIDGFMDFVVMNMRYAANQAKNLHVEGGDKEVEYLIGDRGIAYLKFTKDMKFEDIFVELTVNNILDIESKKNLQQWVQAALQNREIDILDGIKLRNSKTEVEMEEYLEYRMKTKRKENEKNTLIQIQSEQQMAERENWWKSQLEQLKQDSANFRAVFTAEMQAATKGLNDLLKQLPAQPPTSQINQPQEQKIQEQQKQ